MASNNSINNQALNGFTASGGTINIGADAIASSTNISTGAGVKTTVVGSTNSTSATTVQSGSGALNITATNGALTVNSGTGAFGISTDASATTVSIANGAAVKGVTLGSTNSTSATTVQSGSGALNVTATNGALTVNSGTGAMGISTDSSATTLSIGTGSAVKTITVGSTNTTSTTNLTSGSGGVQVATFLGLPTTSSTVGQVKINTARFLHGYGSQNTFAGQNAGNFTITGDHNVGLGFQSLNALSTGSGNTSVGASSMEGGAVSSNFNTAVGYVSLQHLTSGIYNCAMGSGALQAETTGGGNTAIGTGALTLANGCSNNTALGQNALLQVATGSGNVGIGYQAGNGYTTNDSNNIAILTGGVAGDNATMRIGTVSKSFISGIRGVTTANADAIAVLIDSAGQLGTVSSSIRFKENVSDMADDSSDVLKLRPVTFDYIGMPGHSRQLGLIAEEVYEIMPNLVVHGADGEIESVKYHDLPVLLLSELKKAFARIEALELKLKE